MRNTITSAIAAIALSAGFAGAAIAGPNTDGDTPRLTKVLTNYDVSTLVRGIEGAPNDGQEAAIGAIVSNNAISQQALALDHENNSAE